jgi:hypothetical protein
MSKERAVRRAEREHESALRASARAAQQERRERRTARKRTLARKLPRFGIGQQTGIIARRRRARMTAVFCVLLMLQVLVWVVRDDWAARLTALMLSLLVFPLLVLFIV